MKPRKPLPRSTKSLTRKAPLRSSGKLSRKRDTPPETPGAATERDTFPRYTATIRGRSTGKRAAARDWEEAEAFKIGVRDRAHGRCEACPRLREVDLVAIAGNLRLVEAALKGFDIARDCNGWGAHSHHIQPRGMGGHADHSLENGLYTCDAAHVHIHGKGVRLAYFLDLLRRHR